MCAAGQMELGTQTSWSCCTLLRWVYWDDVWSGETEEVQGYCSRLKIVADAGGASSGDQMMIELVVWRANDGDEENVQGDVAEDIGLPHTVGNREHCTLDGIVQGQRCTNLGKTLFDLHVS